MNHRFTPFAAAALSASLATAPAGAQLAFEDITEQVGLAGISAAHVLFADLTANGRPDVVIDRSRVFLHTLDDDAPLGFLYVEVEESGLPSPRRGDICVFADLDNDGIPDAIITRYLDINAEGYEPPPAGPQQTCWLNGNGDGTFGTPLGAWMDFEEAPPATTAAIAIGDVDRNGLLDIYLGNWYKQYGASLEGFHNTLLLQRRSGLPNAVFERADPADEGVTADEHDAAGAPEADQIADPRDPRDLGDDLGGRPTYGVMIVQLGSPGTAQLLDLNYGRRWNSLWESQAVDPEERGVGADGLWLTGWADMAPVYGLDGDDIRHGRHPEWLKERARIDPRFDRPDEKPFRANGNTFDAAIGDINNDGQFDLFFAEITHGWAGESSDRSRFLLQRSSDGMPLFEPDERLSVDRVPADPTIRSWNQGDLYAELADFDLDGRLDLLLASSDYPDNQRLRIWRQQADPPGGFVDITDWSGIDHIGAQHPSLADIDGDGALDIIVGQSFNRLGAAQRAGRTPQVRVYRNLATQRNLGSHLTLKLVGDPQRGVNRDALGAVVRATAIIRGEEVTQMRQLIGIGGHQGKQHEFIVHFGLGDATEADIEIIWPDAESTTTRIEGVSAGRHTIER